MNKASANYINKLLDESELFNSNKYEFKPEEIYDFSEEIILVTGAAGSIGSGLITHLINCKFKHLILVDVATTPLFYLIKDLNLENQDNIDFEMTSIRDEDAMNWVFETYKPTIIFHTAAFKHVTLMEVNPYEAVRLNVIATQLLADLAILHKTKKFIFISTDKAVKPKGVMGMTKYIAEQYLKKLNNKNITSFLIARFGNIFASNGSVVPLFMKQIEEGNSLKVTSEKVSRYFITNQKACNLILKLVLLKEVDSCVFTFNMGDPIKIIDLAQVLIDRYNLTYKNISIEITGLKTGEKLHEDLTSYQESLVVTEDKDILLVKNDNKNKAPTIDFEVLKNITPFQNPSEIKSILKKYI
jgi:FlaA1/EpsC-like NDP-sugar epimerase